MIFRLRAQRREAEPQAEPHEEPAQNSWFNTIMQGFSYGLLGIALAAASIVVVIPKIAGAVPVTILSDSMAPYMPVGSLAIVQPNSPLSRDEITALTPDEIRAVSSYKNLQLGAIVVYQPDRNNPTIIIHRLVKMSAHRGGVMEYTTKGDNNRVPDRDTVADYQIRGTVWYHLPPPIGTFNTWLNHDKTNRTVAIIGIAVVGYLWALFLFARVIWRYRKRRRARLAASIVALDHAAAAAEAAAHHPAGVVNSDGAMTLPKRRELRSEK